METTLKKSVLAVLVLGFFGGYAHAETPKFDTLVKQGADSLLATTDQRHYGYTTQKWIFKMVLKPRSGASRTVRFSTWQKGKKRLVRFLEPGEVKGMSVLVVSKSKMYVYSPQTDNVRRVGAHARRQTFMGSDLTFDDMGQIGLSQDYSPKLGKDEGKYLWMELTRKPDSESQWSKLMVRVNKKDVLIDQIDYYEKGRKVKTQGRFEARPDPGFSIPAHRRIVITDHSSGHKTVLIMEKQELNTDISDRVFKKRNLVRGR